MYIHTHTLLQENDKNNSNNSNNTLHRNVNVFGKMEDCIGDSKMNIFSRNITNQYSYMSDVVKNFVIVVLILTIVHFILKNYLVQREIITDAKNVIKSSEIIARSERDLEYEKRPTENKSSTKEPFEEKVPPKEAIISTVSDNLQVVKMVQDIRNVETPIVTKNSGKLEGNICKTNLEELYHFVYDDDDTATSKPSTHMDDIYSKSNGVMLDKRSVPSTNVENACITDDLFKHPKVVCDSENYIDDIFKKNVKPKIESNKKEQGNTQFSVIQEYANENINNGGRFSNLKGYDALDAQYSFAPL